VVLSSDKDGFIVQLSLSIQLTLPPFAFSWLNGRRRLRNTAVLIHFTDLQSPRPRSTVPGNSISGVGPASGIKTFLRHFAHLFCNLEVKSVRFGLDFPLTVVLESLSFRNGTIYQKNYLKVPIIGVQSSLFTSTWYLW